MHVDAVYTGLEAAVMTQVAIAGGDPAVEEAAGHLIAALGPAVRSAVFDLAEQAAAEISAQLGGRRVEVVVAEGDPVLKMSDADAAGLDEDFDARLTLRLPPSLKGIVEEAAGVSGESVNSWVVNALARAGKARQIGNKVKGSFDL